MKRLEQDFFERDTLIVAKELIGKYLIREINGEKITVMITETEAYIGKIDKACHAYSGKITDRTKVLYSKAGTIYVYLIYGMYYCFNIITQRAGEACGVLIRGAKPIENEQLLSQFRYNKNFESLSNYQKKNFLNGPGKFCKALNIDKSLNEKDIFGNEIYLLENTSFNETIKSGKRINIDYAEEAADFLWRFYV